MLPAPHPSSHRCCMLAILRLIRYAIERKRAEVRVNYLARLDWLTTLPKPARLHDELADVTTRALETSAKRRRESRRHGAAGVSAHPDAGRNGGASARATAGRAHRPLTRAPGCFGSDAENSFLAFDLDAGEAMDDKKERVRNGPTNARYREGGCLRVHRDVLNQTRRHSQLGGINLKAFERALSRTASSD